MKFRITRTANWDDSQPHPLATISHNGEWIIDVCDLDALAALVKEFSRSNGIIVSTGFSPFADSPEMEIEIYDGYKE